MPRPKSTSKCILKALCHLPKQVTIHEPITVEIYRENKGYFELLRENHLPVNYLVVRLTHTLHSWPTFHAGTFLPSTLFTGHMWWKMCWMKRVSNENCNDGWSLFRKSASSIGGEKFAGVKSVQVKSVCQPVVRYQPGFELWFYRFH